MPDDVALLRQFVHEHSDGAFRELVRQRVNFVYAAACRQVGGDVHLAEEVTQNVFLDLARKAPALAARRSLAGWLFTSTRFAAAKALRTRARRLKHETRAQVMNEILSAASAEEPGWEDLRPVLDATMHELDERDREAILLRFFEGRPLADVGAIIGLSENAARMRVDRALEKLRARLARRGITSTAVALGTVLGSQPVIAAPAGLALAAADAALVGAATTGGAAVPFFSLMSTTKIGAGALVVALLAFLGGMYFRSAAPVVPGSSVRETTDQRKVVTAVRADNVSLQDTIARLERERAAAIADAVQARAQSAQAEAQLQSLQAIRAEEVRVQKQRTMINNLRQIAAARDQHRLEGNRAASVADLVGPQRYIRALNAADGEDYTKLDLTNDAVLSLTSANGITATYYLPPPGEMRAPWAKALAGYQSAHNGEGPPASNLRSLVPYFESTKAAADFVEWIDAQKPAAR